MMKKVFVAALVMLVFSGSLAQAVKTQEAAPEQLAKLLEEKEIVCTVEFDVNSAELSREAQQTLTGAVSQIKSVNLKKKMIRIEGFSSPEGNKLINVRLSIDRARAVERFLRANHGVSLDHYISGFGATVPDGVSAAGTRSVQIVIYNNPWGQDELQVVPAGGK